MIDKFIGDVLNISIPREQFLTEVYLSTEYYEIVLKRLYITDMTHEGNYLIIQLNDGRVQKLYITDDIRCELKKTDLKLINKRKGFKIGNKN